MDVFIARQPIFDRRKQVYGYELLYRQNGDARQDQEQVAIDALYNSFFVIGIDDLTDKTFAFIKFSKALVDGDVQLLLPKKRIIVEIPEKNKDQITYDDLKIIKSMGYMILLDGFILEEENVNFLDLASIVKIDYPAVSLDSQAALINRYKNKVLFLAEKIETREEYDQASHLGYDLFQGYFFSKPAYVNSKEIATLGTTLFNIMQELNTPDPRYGILSDLIERDLGLSYKLLKLVNSAYIAPRYKIKSILQALTYLGTREIYQWVSLTMMKDMQTLENDELVRLSLTRGRLMSNLAQELGKSDLASEYFFTGLFSLIDVLLSREMADILEGLPLSNIVKNALVKGDNDAGILLNFVVNYEKAHWNMVAGQYPINLIGTDRFLQIYLDALKWAKVLDF